MEPRKVRETVISRSRWSEVLDASERDTTESGSYSATNNF